MLLESWISWHLSPLAHKVLMSEKPRCQVKRHRSAWEITLAFKVAPWKLTIAYFCDLTCHDSLHALCVSATVNSSCLGHSGLSTFCLIRYFSMDYLSGTLRLSIYTLQDPTWSHFCLLTILPSLEVILILLALYISTNIIEPSTILDTSMNDNKVFDFEIFAS